jgi:hypothetical protein
MFGRLGMYHHLPENRDLRNRDVPRPDIRRAQAKPDDSATLLRLGIVVFVAVIAVALMRWIAL